MLRFILLLFLFVPIFANSLIEDDYLKLNQELDEVIHTLPLEQQTKISVVFFSRYKQLSILTSTQPLADLEVSQENDLQMISNLRNAEKLEQLYINMNNDAKSILSLRDTKFNFKYLYAIIGFIFGVSMGLFIALNLKAKPIKVINNDSLELKDIKLEIQHQKEFIQSLQNELAKYETV